MPVVNVTRKDLASNIPDGTYAIRISKSELRDPNPEHAKPGKEQFQYVALTCVITEDGEFLGRKIFVNATLKPGGAFVVAQLMDIMNLPEDAPVNTDDFEDLECLGVVFTEKGRDGYPDRNQIKKFLPLA